MITNFKIIIIYTTVIFSSFLNSLYSQTTNGIKSPNATKEITIIILGSKNNKNKNLQEFNGSSFGLNLNYFKKIPESEKAILGFIATYAGTECDLEYETISKPFTQYNCRLTLALGIGYQCSEEYLAFERKWFRNDTIVLKQFDDCPISPTGASNVSAFGEIKLTRSPGRIKIYFQKHTFSIRNMRSAEWTETFYFKVDADQIHLIKRTHTTVKVDEDPYSDTLR